MIVACSRCARHHGACPAPCGGMAAAKQLGVIEKAAKKAGVRCECLWVTDEFPANVILAVAKKKKCDLIFMASHGRRGLAGVLPGSETR